MKRISTPFRMLISALLLVAVGIVACPTRPAPVSPVLLGRALLGEPLARQGYNILVEGTDTICGRECITVRLEPRTKPKPWRQLWLDKQSLKVMATRSWDEKDRIVSSSRVDSP